MSKQPSPATEPWEPGIIARYLTVAGATVDVRGGGDHASMTCLGCSLHYSAFGEQRTRELAQGHAEKCRALPRPAVTP
ncbi:hypothetical protein [Streptomyces sp. NPDC001315]|uniref:hypothetical protein n=1 Tax=Streptomyces sp. NPDC001315 TaxID=3364562 RepID=UPI0036B14602